MRNINTTATSTKNSPVNYPSLFIIQHFLDCFWLKFGNVLGNNPHQSEQKNAFILRLRAYITLEDMLPCL
jgi:hypothetical protein